jgi:HEAT repeat protein
MTRGKSNKYSNKVCIALALALALPSLGFRAARAHGSALPQQVNATQQKADAESDERAREREDERRDREQEARDREQEKREREQERLDRAEELYDNGREALEEDRYDEAEAKFKALADMSGSQADAALYWKAYAENKQGKKDLALASIADLKKRYPQSRWQKDAGALELEVRQSTGQPSKPEGQDTEELKMLALQSLMNSNPEQAMPTLEKVLNGTNSPKLKSKALFVLAQSGSPQAREILGRIARGQSNPDLQRKSLEYLGLFGGPDSRKTLADVYTTTNDPSVKRGILRSFMVSGDKEHLFSVAKSEKDENLREEAVRQLGLVHGVDELQQLYQSEQSPAVRRSILQAFFLAGDSSKLLEVAQSDKDIDLRRTAIRNLGLMGAGNSGNALQTIYAKESDRGVREEVLNAFFLQGNAAAIVAIARVEKDPELKKVAVQKLSIMNSKEGTEYLMEILQK